MGQTFGWSWWPAIRRGGDRSRSQGLGDKGLGWIDLSNNDCGEKRNVFGVAIEISESASAAKVALQRARGAVKNAYIKRCAVVSAHCWRTVFLQSIRQ